MENVLILAPMDIALCEASRGANAQNLLRPNPKEVWADSAVGGAVTISLDMGAVMDIDCVFLGFIWNAAAGATWTITGGVNDGGAIVLAASSALRVPERGGALAAIAHAFWRGATTSIRYLRITINQPVGGQPLRIGRLMIGQAWQPIYNQEIGGGRAVKDTGSTTRLPSGGMGVVEGARYATYKFTLGDLTDDEVEDLYAMQMDRGETRSVLVVEDPARSAGLRNRIRYGLFTGLRAFERRDPGQTRWECTIEDWV